MAADLLQNGFGRRLAQRAVMGAGADLDDAPRDHLARARAAARPGAVEIDPKALLEPGKRGLEIEIGIGQRRPTGQRAAVLDLLLAPASRGFLKRGVIAEDAAQMMGIGRTVMLDQACRLDDAEDVGIELCPIEALPGNIVERPRAHAASRRQPGAQCLYTNEPDAVKSLPRRARTGTYRLISASAWSFAWATLCCRSSWRNSASRRSRSVPVARAT